MIGFIRIALMPNCNLDFNFRIGRKHVLCRSRREPNVHARYWRQGGYRVKQGNLTHCWREFSVESLDTVSLLEIVCFLTRDARETENPTLFFSLEEVPSARVDYLVVRREVQGNECGIVSEFVDFSNPQVSPQEPPSYMTSAKFGSPPVL